MTGVGIAVASIAAFVVSSLYYIAATPFERRAVGQPGDRGRPGPWKVLTELARTTLVACAFTWVARRTGNQGVTAELELALVLWVGFPVVLLSGSVVWERVHPATAVLHAGDWLLKLLLVAVLLGVIH